MDTLAVVLLILVTIWYLGPIVNSLVSGLSIIVSKRFDLFMDEMAFEEAKEYDKLGKKLESTTLKFDKKSVKNRLKSLISDSQESSNS